MTTGTSKSISFVVNGQPIAQTDHNGKLKLSHPLATRTGEVDSRTELARQAWIAANFQEGEANTNLAG